jgi:sortase A
MRPRWIKASLQYVLIASGSFLLFLGARDFLESRLGQTRASRDFEKSVPAAGTNRSPVVSRPQPGDTFAKLLIPRLNTELYVIEGDGERELRRGPGHLPATVLPGEAGNCVIAGHRDTHFRVLKDIRKGDDIVLETNAGQFLYRVKSTRVVSPENTSVLAPRKEAELHLITCFPFYYVGSAPKRFIVNAQLAGAIAHGTRVDHSLSVASSRPGT